MARREWIIRRNCSVSPRQLALAYVALCAISLAVAAVFALRGAWYVLVFSILELLVVGYAFMQFGRHVTDREYIVLLDNCLLIELEQLEAVTQFRLDPRVTRIDSPGTPSSLVKLETSGIKVEVGRFLSEQKRRELAQELRSALAS